MKKILKFCALSLATLGICNTLPVQGMVASESSCVKSNDEEKTIINEFVENKCKGYLTGWTEEEIEWFKILLGGCSDKCFFLLDSVYSAITLDASKLVTSNIVISGNQIPVITEFANLFFPDQNSTICKKIQELLSVVPKETKEAIEKCRNVAIVTALKLTQSVQSYYPKGMVLPVHVSKAISSMLAYIAKYANNFMQEDWSLSLIILLCEYYPSSANYWQAAITNAIDPPTFNVNAQPFVSKKTIRPTLNVNAKPFVPQFKSNLK